MNFRHCIARPGTDLKGAQCSLREFSAELQPCPYRDFKQSSSIKARPHLFPTEVKFIDFREFEQFTNLEHVPENFLK